MCKVECVRGMLEGMGFSPAGVEAATSALELDGMVPIGRVMAVAGVSRTFVKEAVARYGIRDIHRIGRGGNLVFLQGILDLAAKADVIRIGDGKFVNRKAVV